MPFKKGQSGNPKGRPRKGSAIAEHLVNALETNKDDIPYAQAIAIKLVELASEGDMTAIKYVMDRDMGKIPESLTLLGDDDNPLSHELTIRIVDDGKED